ncbi:MAG TPA: hypothetical protein PL182_11305, partial [Pseudobdellovibrionaceae bacterium]|nr:hypothetical protein [Pseudobdellovibrionaceae bacterium]
GMSAGKLTGTISVARLPALNGDVTSAAGTATVTVAKIRGKTIASAAPADGQVLTWNDTNGQWEPKTPSGGGGGTLACPGMILVPADLANGKGAFCISAEKPATSYTAMTDTCYSEDGELCSAAEMRRYCKSSGTLSFSAVWTSTVSGVVSGSPKVYKISCSGGSPSGAFSYSIAEISSTVYFRCCRR